MLSKSKAKEGKSHVTYEFTSQPRVGGHVRNLYHKMSIQYQKIKSDFGKYASDYT